MSSFGVNIRLNILFLEKVISKEKTQTNYINVAGIKIETNKSHPISTDLNMSGQDRHNQPRTTTTKIAAGGINLDVNSTSITFNKMYIP